MFIDNLKEGLIGHWPLVQDEQDASGSGLSVRNHGVVPGESVDGRLGARFNGRDAFLEMPAHPLLAFGVEDFSCSAWIYTDASCDVAGDVISRFNPVTRTGWQLSLVTNGGMTSTTQPNYRHLHFGIDAGHIEPAWLDDGRPGNAVLIASLLASNDCLYAGTLETGADERGRLWRYDGDGQWQDLGNPTGCNIVHSLTEFEGQIYCGVGRYIGAGSALGPTLNQTPGGMVYRINSDGAWTGCGHPGIEDAVPEATPTTGYNTGKADDVFALTVYQGRLYCTSNHRRGAFGYEGNNRWTCIGPDERIISFVVYRDTLYALINGGPVFRYEGDDQWTDCGCPTGSTQTYSAVLHAGKMYVGTWPEGEVFRYDGDHQWHNMGRIGFEREIMAMALYNGKAYIGSLPMANIWRLDDDAFTYIDTLDHSAASLRRVWTMAVYRGRLYAGTLPGGHVKSIEAGKMATWDKTFPAGWHHVTAMKAQGLLHLFVDGTLVSTSTDFNPALFDLTNDTPLHIGFGMHDFFNGLLSDVRLYNRALTPDEIQKLAE